MREPERTLTLSFWKSRKKKHVVQATNGSTSKNIPIV